jgi:two-component system cell cycle sensor histidine kinase/response regulator CckA
MPDTCGAADWPDRVKILVVDDEQPLRSILRRILERQGYQVDEAADGRQAQLLCQAGAYDLLLTDLDMPVMSGTELITWLQRDFPGAKFLVVSGSHSDLPRGWPFLSKPVSVTDLLAQIGLLLGNSS